MTDLHDLVIVDRRGPISVVTFNDPARMNPISDVMREAALPVLAGEMAAADIRAIIMTGAGGQFSAGADVRQMRSDLGPDPARSKRRLQTLHALLRVVASGPKPVVAAVEGVAFGAGLSLAVASDYVIAADNARFGAAFGKIGLTADCGVLWSLPQRTGLSWARDMMFTSRQVQAEEALRVGLVDRVVPAGTALDAAMEKAQEYLGTAPLAIAAMKAAIAEGPANLETVLQLETHQQPMLSLSADHEEGRRAFLEKRKPVFIGR